MIELNFTPQMCSPHYIIELNRPRTGTAWNSAVLLKINHQQHDAPYTNTGFSAASMRIVNRNIV